MSQTYDKHKIEQQISINASGHSSCFVNWEFWRDYLSCVKKYKTELLKCFLYKCEVKSALKSRAREEGRLWSQKTLVFITSWWNITVKYMNLGQLCWGSHFTINKPTVVFVMHVQNKTSPPNRRGLPVAVWQWFAVEVSSLKMQQFSSGRSNVLLHWHFQTSQVNKRRLACPFWLTKLDTASSFSS